jgi:o-succinylbenzoate---CoA ligase
MVVEAWLARAAVARPDHVALETPSARVSYAELLAGARAGARELVARGVQPGQRVAIALPAGLAFAEALHACLLIGAIAVPVVVRSPAAERSRLTDGAALEIDQPLRHAHAGERDVFAGGHGAASMAQPHPAAAQLDPLAAAEHDLEATAVVIHTSGTTAVPRPVELSYGNLLWSALGSAVALGVCERERWLCVLPPSHVGGLSILLRSAIYGTTAVVHEHFDTELALRALREQEITLVSLVATTLARLLDAGLEDPPSLRCALTGGGPVPAPLLRRARAARVPVSLTYGLTEACSQVTTTPSSALADDLTASPPLAPAPVTASHEIPCAGYPLFCTRVRIGDEERRAEQRGADRRATGGSAEIRGSAEIMLSGPTIAPASLDRDGWLRTGDEGSFDEHGRLWVSGRRADTIISGGENVAPAEVEAALETHADVLEAAVVGRADERWGEAVTAFVVARPGRSPEADTLRAHCASVLAPHKVPKQVVMTAGPLPRTRSGKLLRRDLG